MSTLLCFGFGYCAQHYAADFGARFSHIVGTTRTAESAAQLAARRFGGRSIEMIVFDGVTVPPELDEVIATADALLISAAPTERGDPALALMREQIAAAPHLRAIVLLSTLGVYGDHAGAWIDETTPADPVLDRGDGRLSAERAWQAVGANRGIPVAVLRLAGIYGPGQNALENVLKGRARRIAKPGQVFNRIHVADIAQAIEAAFAHKADGVFNVCDDEPTPPGDPIVFAANLLGLAPPPEISFDEAAKIMPPMALSFYSASRRVRNAKLKTLGVVLRYPTYREGLQALHAEMQARSLTQAAADD